jgi:predicted PurR-regulated permease PerM
VAFGLIGLFLGPTVLAVGYTLFDAWVNEGKMPEAEGVSDNTGEHQAT